MQVDWMSVLWAVAGAVAFWVYQNFGSKFPQGPVPVVPAPVLVPPTVPVQAFEAKVPAVDMDALLHKLIEKIHVEKPVPEAPK